MLQLLPALLSGGLGLLGGLLQGDPTRERIEESYNRDANKKLQIADKQNQQINPNATQARSRQDITGTRDAAVATAANAAAGNTASSGDFGNGMAKGIAGAVATQAAAAPYAGQLAQVNQAADDTRAQKVQQGTNIANSVANLSNHVSYMTGAPKQNPFLNALLGLQGGVNTGSNIFALLNNRNFNVNGDGTSTGGEAGDGGSGGTTDGSGQTPLFPYPTNGNIARPSRSRRG